MNAPAYVTNKAVKTNKKEQLFTGFAKHQHSEEMALEALAKFVHSQGFNAVVCEERPLFGKNFFYLSIKKTEDLFWGGLELCFDKTTCSFTIKSFSNKASDILNKLKNAFNQRLNPTENHQSQTFEGLLLAN